MSLAGAPRNSEPHEEPHVGRTSRKLQRRVGIRRIAQRLFVQRGFEAVTIHDIAVAANVSVQTIFNHFDTKEALFFDGRTGWVDGPAAAVRGRSAHDSALIALRAHLVKTVHDIARFDSTPAGAHYVQAITTSPILGAGHRRLVDEAERRLREALVSAFADDDPSVTGRADPTASQTAAVIAATWIAATRALIEVHRQRMEPTHPADVATMADRILQSLHEQRSITLLDR